MKPHLFFCNDPFDTKQPDPDFNAEFVAARNHGFTTHLFSFEDLVKEKDAVIATRRIKASAELQPVIYRGWMLKPADYTQLYNALLLKNYKLINTPVEYTSCHYLPAAYAFIEKHTPKTIWLPLQDGRVDFDTLFIAASTLGGGAVIIKDYVKSQKHYWDTACFIPDVTDKEKVTAVVNRFVELQGDDINEGIVMRKFVELANLDVHSKSGMPLKEEYRLFFINHTLVACYDYWEEGEYIHKYQPPLELFTEVAANIPSNFFSLDIARTVQNSWIIIETGDGQVAGLPAPADVEAFYSRMAGIFAQ